MIFAILIISVVFFVLAIVSMEDDNPIGVVFVLLSIVGFIVFGLMAHKENLLEQEKNAPKKFEMPLKADIAEQVSLGTIIWLSPDSIVTFADKTVFVKKLAKIYNSEQDGMVKAKRENNGFSIDLTDVNYKWEITPTKTDDLIPVVNVSFNIQVEK